MNLSTLSGPELRQLLDTARARGQAQLTYQILQEMEARRTAPRGLFRARRSNGAPRELVLDDPPEDDIPPMPLWVAPVREPSMREASMGEPATREASAGAAAPAAHAPLPEPAALTLGPRTPATKSRPKPDRTPSKPPSRRRKPAAAAAPAPAVVPPVDAGPPSPPPEPPPRPRSVWDDPPEEPLDLPPPLAVTRAPKPRALSRTSAVVFAVGMAAGVVLGVGVSEVRRAPPPPAQAPAAVQTAALASPPAPGAAPSPPVAAPAPEAEPTPEATDVATAAAAPPASEAAPSPDEVAENAGPAMELPKEPEAEVAVAEAPRDGCARRATPADRTICGDPELQRLQRELRRAYANALDAHEEKDVLRERQLAWRDARSAVSDPQRLARLYEDRIRRLNAATEAARRAQ